jgi:hypothetical protein
MESVRLTAVAYQTDGVWIVQGIEYDIRARATNKDDAPSAFLRAVQERIALNSHLGKEPLAGVRAAPTRFVEMFENAQAPRPAVVDAEVEVRLVA